MEKGGSPPEGLGKPIWRTPWIIEPAACGGNGAIGEGHPPTPGPRPIQGRSTTDPRARATYEVTPERSVSTAWRISRSVRESSLTRSMAEMTVVWSFLLNFSAMVWSVSLASSRQRNIAT